MNIQGFAPAKRELDGGLDVRQLWQHFEHFEYVIVEPAVYLPEPSDHRVAESGSDPTGRSY